MHEYELNAIRYFSYFLHIHLLMILLRYMLVIIAIIKLQLASVLVKILKVNTLFFAVSKLLQHSMSRIKHWFWTAQKNQNIWVCWWR